jgi:Flp pilus assembly protein TadD
LLNSWLDRLLVLLVITTAVLTLFALRYMGASSSPVQSAPLQTPPSDVAAAPAPAEARDPGFAFAQTGMNALMAGDAPAAIRWFERATQASPDNVEWRRGLKDAYVLNGDQQRASEEALRIAQLEAPAPAAAEASAD